MYSRRAAVVAVGVLRREAKVWRRNPSDFRCSVEIPNSVRSFRAAAESSEVYSSFDGNGAVNGSDYAGYADFNRNVLGRNLGGIEGNQNPSRVYGESGTDGSNFSHAYGDGSGQNRSGYSASSLYSRVYGRSVAGGEVEGIPGRNYGQSYGGQMGNGAFQENVSSNGYNNGGSSNTAHLTPGGVRLENSRGGSYGGMDVNNAGVHPSSFYGGYNGNAGNYEGNLNGPAHENGYTSNLDDLDRCTREGKLEEAVKLLALLEKEGVRVELPQYMALMEACGDNEAYVEAKSVHQHLMKSMVNLNVRMYNQILEMYSKCGSIEDAFAVFDKMSERNLTSWDIMISWLAKNGYGEGSLELFAEFKRSGLKPDGKMFCGVFSACGVVGDIVEGMLHFESMKNDYGIVPSMEHYASIVDMLGTAGCLDGAMEFIQEMPIEPSVEIWEILMNLCRIHGNLALGDQCAELIQLLDPSRLNEQSRKGLIPVDPSELDKEKDKKKSIGLGPLGFRHRFREYRAGDRNHHDNARLYGLLRALKLHLTDVGYVPELKCVLHDVDHESKEDALMAHSERLAAAHGFLASPARASVRIIKNLRVCSDCHNVFKLMSKLVGRELVARDSKRFHHFRDGTCTCNDFW